MSNKQFSQKEQEVLSTYFLNKMSNHLKPIPLHAGKFFDGELEIDVALPFRRIFDFEFEYSEATSNIYIAKNDVFSMKKTIQFAKEFINNFTTVVKINGKYLGEIIKETGYMLRLINNPFVYMDSLRDGGRFLIQCDYLNYKRNSERYKEFRFVQEGSYFRNYENNMKKSLALVTGEMELTKWEFQEAPTFFLGKPKTTAYSYEFFADKLAGEIDPKWYEWGDEFEQLVIPAILEVLNQALIDTYTYDSPISVEELKNLVEKNKIKEDSRLPFQNTRRFYSAFLFFKSIKLQGFQILNSVDICILL